MSGTMDKIKAKVDNVLHKDKTHDDPTGPHSSHATNKADPRVDSDRVGTAGNTAGAGGVCGGQYTGQSHGTTGTHGTTGGFSSTTGSDPTGPHDSRMANKVDPRVDSDHVGPTGNSAAAARNTPGSGLTGTTGGIGSTGTHGTTGGLGSTHTHGTTGGLGSTGYSDPTGPHDSRLGNQADPRVDSSTYGTTGNTHGHGGLAGAAGTHGTHGTTGGLGSHGTHGTTGGLGSSGYSDPTGPHDSRLGNQADPRVDSSTYGTTGNTHGHGGLAGATGHTGTVGSGNSKNTAGPHNSDMLNKIDPRVDSNLDGSKTVGGNATYQ